MDSNAIFAQLQISSNPTYWNDMVELTNAILIDINQAKETQSQIKDLNEEIQYIQQNSKTPEEMKLINEMETLRNTLDKLSTTMNDFNEANQPLKASIDDLKNQTDSLSIEINDTTKQKDALDQKVSQTQTKVNAMNAEFDSKNQLIKSNTEKYQDLLAVQKDHETLLNLLEVKKAEAIKIAAHSQTAFSEDAEIDFTCYEAKIPVSQADIKLQKLLKTILNEEEPPAPIQKPEQDTFSLNESSQKYEFKRLHKGIITAMKFGHLNPFLATAGEDGNVNILDITSYEKKTISGKKAILAVDFNSNDTHLITGCYDSIIRVYDTKYWSNVVKNADNKKTINHVEFCSDDHYASCSQDCKIKIYNINKTIAAASFSCNSTPYYVSSTLGNPFLVSGHADSSIRIWDSRNEHEINSITVHKDKVTQVLGINSTMTIVSLSLDRTIRLIDFRNNSVLKSIDVAKTGLRSDKVRMQIKNNIIYLGANGGLMYTWSAINGTKLSEIQLNSEYIMNLDFRQGTNMMGIGDKKGSIKLFS